MTKELATTFNYGEKELEVIFGITLHINNIRRYERNGYIDINKLDFINNNHTYISQYIIKAHKTKKLAYLLFSNDLYKKFERFISIKEEEDDITKYFNSNKYNIQSYKIITRKFVIKQSFLSYFLQSEEKTKELCNIYTEKLDSVYKIDKEENKLAFKNKGKQIVKAYCYPIESYVSLEVFINVSNRINVFNVVNDIKITNQALNISKSAYILYTIGNTNRNVYNDILSELNRLFENTNENNDNDLEKYCNDKVRQLLMNPKTPDEQIAELNKKFEDKKSIILNSNTS